MIKKILYISSLCSPALVEYLFRTSSVKPLQSVQKFHRLLAEGIKLADNSVNLETLSSVPIPLNHKKLIWNIAPEEFNNISYTYVPVINIPLLKDIIISIYSFFRVILWRFSDPRASSKVVICDVLKLSISVSANLACKLMGIKIIAIVTDLPGLMIVNSIKRKPLKLKIYNKITSKILSNFDGYVLLTEQMNEIVNPQRKPYIIMEGLVNIGLNMAVNSIENKQSERILIYAGGLFEKYGIKKLIDAFILVKGNDLRLHIYGSGEMVKNMTLYMHIDPRIVYKGNVPNQIVVDNLQTATLLINPRPSTEELSKYSFPSKNMEYMASGTPLVTTLLPGMPKDYCPYVYLFDDESVNGLSKMLQFLLSKKKEELHEFGNNSKEFVLKYKNNKIQGQGVLKFISQAEFI
ncbi:MAG: glycosyltransferase family 4 protein [Mariniphaga sp.]|nr:glycosyltransferase family 4 protein [Mariniphaga sp.]